MFEVNLGNRPIIWAVPLVSIFAAVAFFIWVLIMFVGGETFGQKCATVYDKGSGEWHECVYEMANGDRRYVSDTGNQDKRGSE